MNRDRAVFVGTLASAPEVRPHERHQLVLVLHVEHIAGRPPRRVVAVGELAAEVAQLQAGDVVVVEGRRRVRASAAGRPVESVAAEAVTPLPCVVGVEGHGGVNLLHSCTRSNDREVSDR